MPSHPLLTIPAILLALGAVEGIAWWWMNPTASGMGEPVLEYRPQVRSQESVGLDRRPVRQSLGDDGAGPLVANGVESQGDAAGRGQRSEVRGQEEASASSSSPNQKSTIKNQDSKISSSPTAHRSLITDHFSTHTPLPDLYRQAAPMLRCSSGEVFHLRRANGISLHLAWFEWNDLDTGSVLEAFRHPPEACMGAIGMKLVSKEKPIHYVVRGQESEIRDQVSEVRGQESGDRSQEESPAQSSSSTDNRQRTTDNSSTAHRSLLTDHSLHFSHTIFRDPGGTDSPLLPGARVHAFRAVWVSGTPNADDKRDFSDHSLDHLRGIRLKSALTRYRPRHARVIQGTVRGALNTESAWAAFEQSMLQHLTLEPQAGMSFIR